MEKMERYAKVSECGKYRYSLTRIWDYSKKFVTFIGINPNEADGTKDDQTINRLIYFAKKHNYGGFFLANLFAYRSPDPLDLRNVEDPEGPDNDAALNLHIGKDVVFMWGSKPVYLDKDKPIIEKYPDALCFGRSKDTGNPKHPLFLSKETKLEPFNKKI